MRNVNRSSTRPDSDIISEIRGADYGMVPDGVTPCAQALRNAIAMAQFLGVRVVYVGPGDYCLESKVTVPSHITIRGAGKGLTRFISTIVPTGNPNNATFHATFDASTATTALAANNTLGSRTISVSASIAKGSIIYINDTTSGAGLRTQSYRVISNPAGSGPYTITLDRPVKFQYATGDTVSVVPRQPTDIILEDFSIEGSADRFIEFVGARNCIVRRIGMTVTGGASHDIVHSFDVGGCFNLQEDLEIDGGGIAADCLAQEGQEGTVTRRCQTRWSTSYGVVFHDVISGVIEDTHASYHAFGIVITADGTTKGSTAIRIRGGSALDCTTEGLSLVNGSSDVMVDGFVSNYNPKSFTTSNDITNVVLSKCDLSKYTVNAVSVGTGATRIRLKGCNLTGDSTTVAISAAGDLDLDGCFIEACKQIGLFTGKVGFRGCYLKCNPAAPQNVLYLSSGTPRVSLTQCELECATSSCNMFSIAAGVGTIQQTTIKQVNGAAGVLGMYISAGLLSIGSGVDATGCTTPLSGTAKLFGSNVTSMSSPS